MINFNSTNPVIIQFPRFAGGKFISNCLSLSEHTVPQDKKLAEYLLLHPNDYEYRFNNLINTLPPKHDMINWIGKYELGDTQLFGAVYLEWHNGNLGNNQINDITSKLSNSNLKFFISCHSGPEQTYNLLKVWPNATIILLINHVKFSNISAKLKGPTDNIDQYAGNYCKSKYNLLAGIDWPCWEEFESCGFNIKHLTNYPKNILTEIGQFYKWHIINTLPLLFDIDSCIFDKNKFLMSIQTLYQDLNLPDFNATLISNFWQKYIEFHQ